MEASHSSLTSTSVRWPSINRDALTNPTCSVDLRLRSGAQFFTLFATRRFLRLCLLRCHRYIGKCTNMFLRLSPLFLHPPHNLLAQFFIAEAFPEVEGDYPCGTCRSVIRKITRVCTRFRHGEGSFENAVSDISNHLRRLLPSTLSHSLFHGLTAIAMIHRRT